MQQPECKPCTMGDMAVWVRRTLVPADFNPATHEVAVVWTDKAAIAKSFREFCLFGVMATPPLRITMDKNLSPQPSCMYFLTLWPDQAGPEGIPLAQYWRAEFRCGG